MPVSVEEYHIGQLFTLMETSRENTNGDSGVEIRVNEPYENDKMPRIVAALLPTSATMLEEKAWNAYPVCRTEYSNPFLGDRFQIIVQTIHLPDNGSTENAHNLGAEKLAMREIIHVDIAKDPVNDPKPNTDPSVFVSEKTGRGPLADGWQGTSSPVMCCYKLITVKFQVWGFQTKVESLIQENQTQLMTKFHKEIFCAIDRWAGLDMNDIRRLEADIKTELDRKIATQELKPPCTAGWPFVHFYVTFLAVGTPVESVKSNPF